MKKTLLALGVLGAFSTVAFAASQVTLYGIIETGVLVSKADKTSTTVDIKSGFDQGSRWGIKGTEELGNGYSVGFILEQGILSDSGDLTNTGNGNSSGFTRESILQVNGGFGSLAVGRTGALSSGAQSQTILTGWAIGTGYGNGAWTSLGYNFSRMNNVVSYVSPKFAGFTVHAMYSNGANADSDDGSKKWSKNDHYYGLGVKYKEGAINSSLIFEAGDNKVAQIIVPGDDAKTGKGEAQYVINFGFEYDLGMWTPMFAYQYNWQDGGNKNHIFGLSAKVKVAGGTIKAGARYLFGKTENQDVIDLNDGEDKQRAWTIGAAYDYPLSKRTALKVYAGYAGGDKIYDSDGKYYNTSGKETKYGSSVNYNGYQLYVGMTHSF